jgi:hypothetical protein
VETDGGSLTLYHVIEGDLKEVKLASPESGAFQIEVCGTADLIGVLYRSGTIRVFDPLSGGVLAEYPRRGKTNSIFGFSVHGNDLVSVDADGYGRIIPMDQLILRGKDLLLAIGEECLNVR